VYCVLVGEGVIRDCSAIVGYFSCAMKRLEDVGVERSFAGWEVVFVVVGGEDVEGGWVEVEGDGDVQRRKEAGVPAVDIEKAGQVLRT